MNKIQMVDLKSQYQKIKTEVDSSIQSVIDSTSFIKGGIVEEFANNLASFLSVKHVILAETELMLCRSQLCLWD